MQPHAWGADTGEAGGAALTSGRAGRRPAGAERHPGRGLFRRAAVTSVQVGGLWRTRVRRGAVLGRVTASGEPRYR